MMRKIIENSHGHPSKNQKILLSNEIVLIACSVGKFIVKPSPSKVGHESPLFFNEFKEIYIGQSIHLVDYYVILWF